MSETTTEAEPSTPPASSGLPFAVKMVGGFVVVAIVVGIGLVARELTGDDLTLPTKVAGLDAIDSEAGLADLSRDRAREAREFHEMIYAYNNKHMSESLDGAEVATRRYGNGNEILMTVMAIRSELNPPIPDFFIEPESIDLERPVDEMVEDGPVTCRVHRNFSTREGEDEIASIFCQRSSGSLTVRVLANFEPDVDDVVDATDEVWEELS
jgi:hypothetical protein